MSRFICLFFLKKVEVLRTLFARFFARKKSRNFILDTIGNYFDLAKNPRAIENSRVKKKKLAISYLLFYNFKCQIQNLK